MPNKCGILSKVIRVNPRNECEYGCPPNTHCEWGLCECNEGYSKSWGVCMVISFLLSFSAKFPIRLTWEMERKGEEPKEKEEGVQQDPTAQQWTSTWFACECLSSQSVLYPSPPTHICFWSDYCQISTSDSFSSYYCRANLTMQDPWKRLNFLLCKSKLGWRFGLSMS